MIGSRQNIARSIREAHPIAAANARAIAMKIDWKPLPIPDALRDGRQVLIWDGEATACRYHQDRAISGWDTGCASEIDGDRILIDGGITHYAEIEGPE